MVRLDLKSARSCVIRFFVFLQFASTLALTASANIKAVGSDFYIYEGYVTSVDSSGVFIIDGDRYALTPNTLFGLLDEGQVVANSPLRQRIQPGVYVKAKVERPWNSKVVGQAFWVLVRPDWDLKIAGFGVIDKIVSDGTEPVYRADGYFIRVPAAAKLKFKGSLNSLAEVGTNTWMSFEGKPTEDGLVVADSATFFPAKPTQFKAVPVIEVQRVDLKRANDKNDASVQSAAGTIASSEGGADLQEDKKVRIGVFGRWHTLPATQPIQQRVDRIGMSLIPMYQRGMKDDDPSKIHFRFFAMDDKSTRRETCLLDGAILIPTQVLDQLQNDDQVAAVLADGVAYNLQRQAIRTVVEMRKALALSTATNVVADALPVVGLVMSGAGMAQGDDQTELVQERARIALALMQDAGYDLHQAPEAWRLLSVKALPKDLSKLKYPEMSQYQLNTIYLQYRSAHKSE